MSILSMVVVPLCVLGGCARPFTAVAPDGFAAYSGGRQFRAVNHEGVAYRVRHTKNSPYAEFPFWREALPKKMRDSGYRVIRDTVVSVDSRDALLLELAAPLGESDYSYLILMALKGKRILIAEAAGEVAKVQSCREAIEKALHGIALK